MPKRLAADLADDEAGFFDPESDHRIDVERPSQAPQISVSHEPCPTIRRDPRRDSEDDECRLTVLPAVPAP